MSDLKPVDLFQLQSISLVLHPLVTQQLLRHLRIPTCSYVALTTNLTAAPLFSAATGHLSSTFASGLTSTMYLVIMHSRRLLWYCATITAGVGGDGYRKHFSINNKMNNYAPENLTWMLDNLRPPPFVASASLKLLVSDYPIQSILDPLSSVITTLNLYKESRAVLSYLSTPSEVAGTLKWPLPRLTSLTIEQNEEPGHATPKDVLSCLEARAGQGPMSESHGGHKELPVSLSKLRGPAGKENNADAAVLAMAVFVDYVEWG